MSAHWILKTEPGSYSFGDLQREGRTRWDGVRNHQARNYIGAMRKGDWALIYHSHKEKCVVGIARVVADPYPDPTASDNHWLAVDVEAVTPVRLPVSLTRIKGDPDLRGLPLVRLPRLSVTPLTEPQFKRILYLGRTKLP